MEIETELINNVYKYPFILCENHMKPFTKNDFPIESSPPPNSNYLQDFHHLDNHQFQPNHQVINPIFPPFDPIEVYTQTANNSSNHIECNNEYDTHRYKPFGQAVTNPSGDQYYLNLPPRNAVLDMINGSDWNCLPSSNCQEIVKPASFAVADHEVSSCITAENGYYKKVVAMNKNSTSRANSLLTKKRTYKGYNKTNKANPIKGQWTREEDRLLIQLVDQHGLRKWSHIAQMLPGRIGKQCRERWHNHLRPDIKKETWSEEEDKVLIEAHVEIGNKWAEIAKKLPGRTENSIKNHWNATKRRQHSKRKCRSKCPRPSLLQDYIKSLNLDSTSSSSTRVRQHNQRKMTSNNIIDDNIVNNNNNDQPHQSLENMAYEHGFDDDDESGFGFGFGKNMMIFQEGNISGTIDSLFDDIVMTCDSGTTLGADHNNKKEVVIVDIPAEDHDNSFEAVMLEESDDQAVAMMKKELDLVEMISQVNNA